MPKQLPEDVRESIREKIYALADRESYLAQDRISNGRFMYGLTRNPEIGGVLKNYMPDGEIKTYIKDAVLNRYAKERRAEAQNRYKTEELISDFFGPSNMLSHKNRVGFYKSTERMASFCVVGEGTADKWETALRHALDYIVGLPEETQRQDIRIALRCSSPRGKLSQSEKGHITNALTKIGVRFYCIEF